MQSSYGTFRLVYEDAIFYFGKLVFLYITIPLFLMWLVIGYTFGLADEIVAAISGPAYFLILFFGLIGYRSLYPIAIGMGSTRTQLLKLFSSIGILAVILCIFFLNILQFILRAIFASWGINPYILHPGILIVGDYHFLAYLWVDLMLALVLFGVSFLLYSINYRIGIKKSLVILMILAAVFMFLFYGGYLNSFLQSFMQLDFDELGTIIISSFGLTGAVSVLLSYLVMRNAPLKPKLRKD